jgi:4-amino-4-deoxy-L-arabinose transferase-like glycosyltransferase
MFTIFSKKDSVLSFSRSSLYSKLMHMNTWIQIAFLGCICFFSFFIHLDAHDVDLMEARNFITAREIVNNGTWLVPTMNGEIRINKPPLPTWITAVARIAGGDVDNNLIMRLPAAMMASMLVFSLWGFMRTLSEDRLLPFMTAAILATSLLIINKGRRGTWDIYCHSFMLMAIWVLSHGWNKKESAFWIFALAGTLLAFSFMSKGPVSFYALLLPFFIGYVYAFGTKKVTRKWRELLLAMTILGLISCIWPAFIYFKHPELSAVIAKYEISSWTSRHVEPFYFYVSFPLYTGIWAVFVIAGFIKPYASKKIENFGSYRFILSWIILSLLLLSIIPEKKTRYLLPAMIPMAVMVGYLIRSLVQAYEKRQSSRGDDRLVIIHTIISCIIVLSMPGIL